VKKGFRDMQERMNSQHQQDSFSSQTQSPNSSEKTAVGDYIDFEEIK
jgi:hypothetical protein